MSSQYSEIARLQEQLREARQREEEREREARQREEREAEEKRQLTEQLREARQREDEREREARQREDEREREARQREERERQLTEQLRRATEQQRKTTPPETFENNVPGTPFRSTSASQTGNEQTHLEVDKRISDELEGRVYNDVGGFYERYFEGKSWTVNEAEDTYSTLMVKHVDGRWNGWPEPSFEGRFIRWFMGFQDTVLSGLGRRYYTSANKTLNGSETNRKLDIFLAPTDAASSNNRFHWSDVLVIGEHKQNPAEDGSKTTLLQLAGYAREVFGSQPYRRFVLGFTICGSLMRLWVFDRSGAYSSKSFNIHQEPKRFVNVVRGCALMTEAELGLNTFVQKDGTDRYIMANGTKIFLEGRPIASQSAIVSRGTTCFRGSREPKPSNWEYVVKFSWTAAERRQEGHLLHLAKENGVTGIAELVHHEQVNINGEPDTVVALRSGLEFGPPSWFSKTSSLNQGIDLNQTEEAKSVQSRALTRGQSSTSSQGKRKHDPNDDAGNSRPRRRSRLSNVLVNQENIPGHGDAAHADKANLPSHSDKKSTSTHSIEEADTDSLVGIQGETYGNRIHHCLVVSPAGRPLSTYKCVKELLEAFRDAIAGHRSLLENANILHRDISENNIIINEFATEGSPKGLLIDLDMAKKLGSKPCGATYRTGTMQFMAIEVLQGKGHTYRHDLESFFYVFIWMCIRYGHDPLLGQSVKPTRTSILRFWYTGAYDSIANAKLGHMSNFNSILAEFSPYFICLKDLAQKLRDVLFGYPHLATFTGTYKSPSIMYDGMINAFNKKLRALETETEQDGVGKMDSALETETEQDGVGEMDSEQSER